MPANRILIRFVACAAIAMTMAGSEMANAKTNNGIGAGAIPATALPAQNSAKSTGQTGMQKPNPAPPAADRHPTSRMHTSGPPLNTGPAAHDNSNYGAANYKKPNQIRPIAPPPNASAGRAMGPNLSAPAVRRMANPNGVTNPPSGHRPGS